MFKTSNVILLIATLVFLTSALFSLGYYHADEHFQIIEFAGIKSGFTVPNQLPWEFAARLRPAIQPGLAYLGIEFCQILSISNPYYQLTFLKIISALFAVFTIHYFVNSTIHLIKESKTAYRIISFCLWFIPVVSIRFSSETWGGILILLTLAYMQDKYLNKKIKTIKVFVTLGLLFGFSFLFRYQMIFMAFGVFCWLLFYKKEKITNLLWILFGGVLAVGIGILIDYWYYEELVFSFWNYFYGNIIEDIASNFGTSPWYYYFVKVWQIPVFGIMIAISTFIFIFIVKKYKSVYLWALVPFILVHTLIAHNEFRFIFPIVYFAPLIITLAYDYLHQLILHKIKIIKPIFWSLFITLNLLFITVTLIKREDDNGRHYITKYLYDNYRDQPINIISTPYSSPYSPFRSNPNFYLTDNITETRIGSFCDLDSTQIIDKKVNFFISRKVQFEVNKECNSKIDDLGFKKVKQSIPVWIENIISSYYDEGFGAEVLVLYSLDSK